MENSKKYKALLVMTIAEGALILAAAIFILFSGALNNKQEYLLTQGQSADGEYVISVCQGTACYVKGAKDVLDEVIKELAIQPGETTPDGKFSIQDTRCLGCCGLAPVMTINEKVYGRLTAADIKDILAQY